MTDTSASLAVHRWQDRDLAPAERAAALLSEMTAIERLQQLGSTWPGQGEGDGDGEVAPMQESFDQAQPFEEAIRHGLGHLTRPFGTAPISPEAGMRRLADLQRAVMAANRFRIPAIAHEECLTGFTAWTATVYPTSLAWGATFDPDLIAEMSAAIGRDLAAVGVHQGLAPVLDVVRDYRWGRVEETIGEDPVLVSAIGTAYVQGLQSAGIVATLKHFAGYSASRAARNHAPVSIGTRELADVVLPPFRCAILAGARSVMNSYADIDGVAPAADESLLTDLLRTRWGFRGTVVSDYWAIPFLETMHGVASSIRDAGRQALGAGIDVELPHTLGYSRDLVDDLDHGLLDAALIDRAAMRVLTQKAELGLLDAGWAPNEPEAVELDSPGNRSIARRIAEQSIVLLENPTALLPITSAYGSIAVIGPIADDPECLFGCYSFPNHVVPNFSDASLGIHAPTFLEGIRSEFPHAVVRHERGVDVIGGDPSGIAAAVEAAEQADLTILMVGDRAGMFGHGTSGEGCDVADLRLPGYQQQLADAVLAAAVTPVVLVVSSGRPYAIGALARRATSTLQCFLPGEEGAAALASVLSGRVHPSGRLPVQIPGDDAPQPGTYLAAPLALQSDGVSNIDPTPAYPFGYGLGYTTFTCDDVSVDRDETDAFGEVVISATITNTGTTDGAQVVQLYVSDPVATVVRPVRRLVGFSRVTLGPGDHAVVRFRAPTGVAAFSGRDFRRRVEPGELRFTVAASAADPGQQVAINVTGPVRFLDELEEYAARSGQVVEPAPVDAATRVSGQQVHR